MGFKIRAAIAFTAVAAIRGIANVRKNSDQAKQSMNDFGTQVNRASKNINKMTKTSAQVGNLTTKPLKTATTAIKKMARQKGPTKFQRDVKLANQSLNSLLGVSQEVRRWFKILRRDSKVKVRGVNRAKRSLRQIRTAARSVRNEFGQIGAALGIAFGAIGAGAVFGELKSFFSKSVEFANNMENARITFDVMLGTAQKSERLLQSISTFAAQTPFQRADIIEASKTLLRVTRQNVGENERLFKLSAQIAALKPGRKVADVGLGIAQAAVGEFEILKSFGIVLRAEQFKDAGVKGGASYAKAVTGEIQRQFTDLTGGRDLIGLLSKSLTGKVSTLRDNIEQSMEVVGKGIIDGLGIKGIVETGIAFFSDFRQAIVGIFDTGIIPKGLSENAVLLAVMVKDAIQSAIQLKVIFTGALGAIKKKFDQLSPSMKEAALKIGALVAGLTGGAGIVGPLLFGLVTIVTALSGVFGTMFAAILPIAKLLLVTVAPTVIALVGAFLLFRRRGEGVAATFVRLFETAKRFAFIAFMVGKAFFTELARPILENIMPAWNALQEGFARLQEEIGFLLVSFGDAGFTLTDFGRAGARVGGVLTKILRFGVRVTTRALIVFANVLKALRPVNRSVISDLRQMLVAFFKLVTGVGDAKSNLKTFMLGVADILTTPFREAIAALQRMFADQLTRLSEQVRPFSGNVADRIEQAASLARTSADRLSEGLLRTVDDVKGSLGDLLEIKLDADLEATATTPVQLLCDGEVLAEAAARTEMRARNAGRGGDPMTPEELGFVLEGANIRTVSLAEVAERS